MVCKEYPYGLIYKKISSSSVAQYRRKVRCYFQDIIAFFSKSVRPRNMKFGLQRVSIWVNIQKNFKFLGRTVSEKNAMLICKISKLFIRTIVQL